MVEDGTVQNIGIGNAQKIKGWLFRHHQIPWDKPLQSQLRFSFSALKQAILESVPCFQTEIDI